MTDTTCPKSCFTRTLIAAVVFLLFAFVGPVCAEVRLPHLLSDHMVLQRDMPIRIWGWAEPGEPVAVTLGDVKLKSTADKDGEWEVEFPAMKAGGPYDITVQGSNKLEISDVLIGEVWFCSGQSNMAVIVLKSLNFDAEIAAADYPEMRLLTAPERRSDEPEVDIDVEWRVCSPKSISWFSAAAYYFGRELHQELDVPVGLMVSAVNGTRIEPWTPAAGVSGVEKLKGIDEPKNGDLYNGMIHPFTRLPIRGVIWYQGEGNVGDGMLYYHRMRALVEGWRSEWGQGDFPFYYVQLTPLDWGGKPKTMHAELWEAQLAALAIPNTGMAVTTDIVGHVGDAHPKNKQEVGRRLSLWALANTYGHDDLPYSGPLFKAVKVEGNRLRVEFHHSESGLASRDGEPLTWFTIAGEDGEFVDAHAEIDGDSVVVWADGVESPVEVRFGWYQTAEPNLMNKHRLPASPFRAHVTQ